MRNITDPGFMDAFARRQAEPVDAVPTPLAGLNRVCRDDGGGKGFAPGWFVTIGGNPGFGKSVAALNLASAALDAGERVAYVSLEMTVGQLGARFYAIHTGQPIARLERGNFDEGLFGDVRKHVAHLPDLYVPEEITGQWEAVVEFVHQAHEEGCRYFIVDYLQLIQIGVEEQITRAMTQLVTDLRRWAASKGTIVVALSQFNRQTSAEYSLRPRAQGLYGGMMLEASSDLVLLLDHSRYRRSEHLARTWLLVEKNRHGPQGQIPILWDYRSLQMREALEDELHEWPGVGDA